MYHVYVDAQGVETVTPDFEDANRAFRKYIREYPDDTVEWDKIESYDQELGAFGAKRIQACIPQ